jgi:hypothetical protein
LSTYVLNKNGSTYEFQLKKLPFVHISTTYPHKTVDKYIQTTEKEQFLEIISGFCEIWKYKCAQVWITCGKVSDIP